MMSVMALSLRPSSIGDILDRAVWLYRKNFITLIGIVALVNVPLLLLQILVTTLLSPLSALPGGNSFINPSFISPTPDLRATIIYEVAILALAIISALATVFEVAALTVIVSERYLGRTVTIWQAYRRAFERWLSLLIAAFVIGVVNVILILLWLGPLVVLGILGPTLGGSTTVASLAALGSLCACIGFIPAVAVFAFLNVKWAFTSQTIMLENQNSTGAMRRSWNLVRGSFWRLFICFSAVVLFLYTVFYFPALPFQFLTFVILPFSPLAYSVVNILLSSLIQALLLPLGIATLTLLYYDLRIRREGLDLEMALPLAEPVV
jgi:hypothetical protein